MTRPAVIGRRKAVCGSRMARTAGPPARADHSPIHAPQSAVSYLPVGEQHAARRVRLRISLEGHPQIGPADPVPARDETAEGLAVPGLAAHGDPPDPRLGGGGFDPGERALERARVPRRELEHTDLIVRLALGDRKSV